jgi:hypothetical protein
MLLHRFLLAAGCLAALAAPAAACGFIDESALLRTLREDAAASKIILFGHLENARESKEGGSTDFVILKAIEGGSLLGERKVIRLPKYTPIDDPKTPPQYLAFGEINKGVPELFKGVPGTRALVEYVTGVRAFDGKDRVKLMRYCSAYLEHAESEIAADAFNADFRRSSNLPK